MAVVCARWRLCCYQLPVARRLECNNRKCHDVEAPKNESQTACCNKQLGDPHRHDASATKAILFNVGVVEVEPVKIGCFLRECQGSIFGNVRACGHSGLLGR